MRTFVSVTSWALAAAGIFSTACGQTTSTCDELFTCGTRDAGPDASNAGGASGTGGKASSTGGHAGSGTGGSGGGASGAPGTGGSNGQAGADAQAPTDGGPDADASPPCDETKSPSVESCLVADRYAVFVALGGTGNGTKASPVGTLAQGVANAKSLGLSRIIVCDATYQEALSLDASAPKLRIFGGFHCPGEDGGASWTYESGKRPLVAPKGAVPALNVDGVTASVLIQDVDFASADGTTAHPSSIAGVVHGATGITLRRVHITAGKGADGAKGVDGVKGTDGADPTDAQKGATAICTNPPPTQPGGVPNTTSSCGSQGGLGGAATKNAGGSDGASGSPDVDVTPPGKINKGTGETGTTAVSSGTDGAPGKDGDAPLTASGAGTFTSNTFVVASGLDGNDGFPGQGGGGGGASKGSTTCVGASGGAGGMGGCGGTHGSRGVGGGASVALLVSGSSIVVDNVVLTSSIGGKGGDGGSGGDRGVGKTGAPGGDAAGSVRTAGGGGRGGDGGLGSPASGGTGGPSYAVVSMSASTVTPQAGVVMVPGAGGAKGVAGSLGTDSPNPALNGHDGASGAQLTIPSP